MIEVKRSPEGKVLARRTDGQPLTAADREIAKTLINEEDPILTPEQWYPEFHRFHVQVVQETPNLEWQWLREHQPDLYRVIKGRENELDALGEARLSEVMEIMGQWRALILQAEMEATKAPGQVLEGPNG